MRFPGILKLFVIVSGLLASSGQAAAQGRDNQQLKMPERPSGNYSFLEGCWITDVFKHSPSHQPGRSTYCFQRDGSGTVVFDDGRMSCKLRATAKYQGERLRFSDEDGTCNNGVPWYADHLVCERRAEGVAHCSGTSVEVSWVVTLRRVPDKPAAAKPPEAPQKSLRELFNK